MKKNTKLVAVLSAAALMTIGMASMAFAANSGWQRDSSGTWYYYSNSGDMAQEQWKKSGDYWYWLGADGKMATDSFVEDGDNYYYVNEDGVMITNQWKYIHTDYTDDYGWYYFGPNGKAVKKTGTKAKLQDINGKRYIFDENGVMLYGWVNEEGDMLDEDSEDAWKEGMYYCGSDQDGAVTNGWISLDVDDDDNDNYNGYYWFYFNPTNGKKVKDEANKNINGKRYGFDENGAMLYEFSAVDDTATSSNAVSGYKYYQDYDNGVRQSGWFKAVPDENVHPEAYDDGDEKWFYANSNGTLKASTLASISGKKYAFNEYGEMLTGLRGLELDGSTIVSYTDEIEEEQDLDLVEGTAYAMYYFGDEDDGSMKKTSVTINLDGESYKYDFKSSGEGREGIYKDCIYVKGRRIDADSDKGYILVDENGIETKELGEAYLVNTSGKIQKKKTNAKDKDDTYYCTDAEGKVTYIGDDKYKD